MAVKWKNYQINALLRMLDGARIPDQRIEFNNQIFIRTVTFTEPDDNDPVWYGVAEIKGVRRDLMKEPADDYWTVE